MKDKAGSALILTMFIMSGILIVAMSGAYVVWLGIKAGGIQAQSTKAYYAAEGGAERFLYAIRRQEYEYNVPGPAVLFSETFASSGASYKVYFTDYNPPTVPLIFQSIGDFQNTKRNVEVRFGD